MLVFRAEREAGLEPLLTAVASRTIGMTSLASWGYAPEHEGLLPPEHIARAERAWAQHRATATNLRQPDLFYLSAVLASSVWNENDDVFDRAELWAARTTPEDKPFNYNHQQDDIIGHITGNLAVDDNGLLIAPDSTVEDLPELYHIVTSAVLYKVWEDETLQERMDAILEEIPQNKWYVSMECLFNQFDYAIRKPGASAQPEISVLVRGENTAFLTKHLRAYGGDGTYEGMQVGRLLRNFTFSGKGLVKEPANPSSIIITSKSRKTPQLTGTGYAHTKGENHMADSATTQLESRNAELTAKVEKLEAALRENESKNWAKQVETLTAALKSSEEKLQTEVKSVADLKVKLDEVSKAYQVSSKSLTDLQGQVKTAQRISLASDKLTIDKTKATRLVESLTALDDTAFAALIQTQADMLMEKGASNPGVTPPSVGTLPGMDAKPLNKDMEVNVGAKDGDMDETGKCKKTKSDDMDDLGASKKGKADSQDGDDDEEESEAALAGILDRARPKKSAALAVAAGDEGVQSLQADVLRFFGYKTEGEK